MLFKTNIQRLGNQQMGDQKHTCHPRAEGPPPKYPQATPKTSHQHGSQMMCMPRAQHTQHDYNVPAATPSNGKPSVAINATLGKVPLTQ
jgi:hypothetical protein